MDDCQLNSYGYLDNRPLTGLSMKSLYHHLEQDSNLQALNISPTMYHLAALEPRAHMLTVDPPDEQPVYYQSRAGAVISSPMLYHTANQHYGDCGTAVFGGSPASTPSQCVSAGVPTAKQVEGIHEPFLMSRHESFAQKVPSSPSRYIHGQAQGKAVDRVDPGGQRLTQISSGRGRQDERAQERVTVKQESLCHSYLEDGEYYYYCIVKRVTQNPTKRPTCLQHATCLFLTQWLSFFFY